MALAVEGDRRHSERGRSFLSSIGSKCVNCHNLQDVAPLGPLQWKIETRPSINSRRADRLCPSSVAIQVLLWIKIIAFTLFHAFIILHGRLLRLGKVTYQE